MHYKQLEPTSFIHTIYITGHESNPTTFNGETDQQFPYNMSGMMVCDLTTEHCDAFSLLDKIGTSPHIEIQLNLHNEVQFCSYVVKRSKTGYKKRNILSRKLGMIKKRLTRYSSPVLLVQ